MSSLPRNHAAPNIDPRAVVDPRASLHPTAQVGPFAVVGPHVTAAERVVIGPHAVLEGTVELAPDVRISPFACIGTPPQDRRWLVRAHRDDEEEPTGGVRIGAHSTVREYVTVNRGTTGWTSIGADVLVMANSHVAHDCTIGDRTVLANQSTLAGHVELDHDVTLGGLVAIQQHTRIGRLAFLAGGAMVERDVPPFCRAAGDRARLVGLNLVGLRRAGLGADTIATLGKAYRALFRTREPLEQALAALRATPDAQEPLVHALIDFVARSERGIAR